MGAGGHERGRPTARKEKRVEQISSGDVFLKGFL